MYHFLWQLVSKNHVVDMSLVSKQVSQGISSLFVKRSAVRTGQVSLRDSVLL